MKDLGSRCFHLHWGHNLPEDLKKRFLHSLKIFNLHVTFNFTVSHSSPAGCGGNPRAFSTGRHMWQSTLNCCGTVAKSLCPSINWDNLNDLTKSQGRRSKCGHTSLLHPLKTTSVTYFPGPSMYFSLLRVCQLTMTPRGFVQHGQGG